ncbi:MAG: hypothetical protein GXX10_06325 [Clostridiaceae bacterium]|nr:hypothetical protein [Clostridiaceae bacterium]
MDLVVVNLEDGRPTRDMAIRRMIFELNRARAGQAKVVKLIHGYGSSGVGGVLRIAVRKELERMKKRGLIKLYVPGENFEIFSPDTIKMLDNCNALRSDRDLGRFNNGITLVLL